MNYYGDNDAKSASWLKALIEAKLIPDGEVDNRSITEVRATDLKGFTQCHFFAGIGGWAYALSLVGWRADYPVWTGSCPCQPFSAAGKRKGTEDERHLWPEFFRLIAECHPTVVFGEQVASADGRKWLAGVRADLEGVGYAVGAADLCAAGVGAPHIRQRLYWVADSTRSWRQLQSKCTRVVLRRPDDGYGDARRLANADVSNKSAQREGALRTADCGSAPRRMQFRTGGCSESCGLADATSSRRQLVACGEPTRVCAEVVGSTEQREQSGNIGSVDGLADSQTRRRDEIDPVGDGRDEGGRAQGCERSGYSGGADGLADAEDAVRRRTNGENDGRRRSTQVGGLGFNCRLGDAKLYGSFDQPQFEVRGGKGRLCESERSDHYTNGLGDDDDDAGCETRGDVSVGGREGSEQSAPTSAWSDFILAPCRDPKRGVVYRRVPPESAFQPLAHGIPGRVAQLRGLGNAIVPQVAAAFVEAYLECVDVAQ